jgi:hypothetical protein
VDIPPFRDEINAQIMVLKELFDLATINEYVAEGTWSENMVEKVMRAWNWITRDDVQDPPSKEWRDLVPESEKARDKVYKSKSAG